MIYEIKKDLKKSYFSTLFSPNLEQWLVKEKDQNEQLIGSGSYGKVYLVELYNGNIKKTVVEKVTRTRGNNGSLSDDFVREFGILEHISRATVSVDRLIRMLGVKMNLTAGGIWQTSIYTPFYST